MESVRGRTVLVTGAAHRIGRSLALALAEAGAGVVVHFNRSEEEAVGLRDVILGEGGRCWLVRADLEREDEVERLVEDAVRAAGRPIDALVNNAAIFPTDTLATVSRESLWRCMSVNAWAPFALCRAFARQAARGHVVNLLDAKLEGYRFSHVAYQASKQVLAMLTRMLALDLAPGITVNAVAPGLVLPPPGRDERWLDREAREAVPLARPGTLREIADAVLFLLGSDYLTGQVLYVDGGVHLLEPGHGPHPH
jgi:pteridine reductase